MAILDQLKTEGSSRYTRYFSESFKRQKVEEIEKKVITIAELCKQYGVSGSAVYKWIYKYSLMRKKGVKMVVEAQSDTARITALQHHIAELEQLLGQKQFQIEFLDKQLQLASDQYGVDLKKKPFGKPLPGTGNTGENTSTK